MESQNLKQRTRDETPVASDDTISDVQSTDDDNMKNKKERKAKMVKAKGGVRSLILSVALPLSATLAAISSLDFGRPYGEIPNKPFWYPPLWALHLASVASSLLMGLSAWLVWAEGGFHNQAAVLFLYLAQLVLGLSWAPITFVLGYTMIGLVVCMVLLGALVGCSQSFRKVNPIAGDLVMPCLAWVAFMTIVNFSLLYL
ncbi:translocator protein homolog [Macadamia integrifolia]|uniref:translocator protein homolog n=1 Tax=Macadamia integrifolia TaxID=60698 RepID=UPI001C4E3A27|nr:translocator protein homolog [Macadamia integrifolia]